MPCVVMSGAHPCDEGIRLGLGRHMSQLGNETTLAIDHLAR